MHTVLHQLINKACGKLELSWYLKLQWSHSVSKQKSCNSVFTIYGTIRNLTFVLGDCWNSTTLQLRAQTCACGKSILDYKTLQQVVNTTQHITTTRAMHFSHSFYVTDVTEAWSLAPAGSGGASFLRQYPCWILLHHSASIALPAPFSTLTCYLLY